jgi:hypothetical protein
MSISSINYGASLLGLSVQNINNQLSNLSTELSSGVKSPTYAGMGVDEGFAIAARSQLANISAFTDTMTNVNTVISAANTALQSISSTTGNVQSAAAASPQNLTSSGQTIGQQSATSDLSALVGILNTQVGNRYIFSGSAINTPAVASANDILNGTATQAGLKQVIAERQQAHLVTDGAGGGGAGRRRCRRLAVRLQAELGDVVADQCHGDRSFRLAAVGLGRHDGRQPEPGRSDQLHLQSARRYHRIRPVDRDHHDAAAKWKLRHRRHAGGNGGEPAISAQYVDRHAGQYLADGGVGRRSR